MAQKKQVLKAIDAHGARLRKRKNVVGFGVRQARGGGEAMAVYVSKKEPLESLDETDRLPDTVEIQEDSESTTVPVAVVELGGMPIAE